jgi:hypothetical protein
VQKGGVGRGGTGAAGYRENLHHASGPHSFMAGPPAAG